MTQANAQPTTSGADDHYACTPDECDVVAARIARAEQVQHAAAAELPGRRPGRAAKIAAIYMLAHWLIEHPDVPVPDIMATYTLRQEDEPDQGVRYREIELLAEQLGAREYGSRHGDRSPQFDFIVASREVHGIEITYRGSTWSDIKISSPL